MNRLNIRIYEITWYNMTFIEIYEIRWYKITLIEIYEMCKHRNKSHKAALFYTISLLWPIQEVRIGEWKKFCRIVRKNSTVPKIGHGRMINFL